MKLARKLSSWDVFLILLFVTISFVLIINHEPWRDEAHHWLIAGNSPNFESLISQIKYEGTPGLWDSLLFLFAQLGFPYFTMHIIHFLIALGTVIVFLKFSPFNRTIKTLFIFGYFILYEYNVIARNYALSVLFLFLIAVLFQRRFRTWMYPFLIFLLSNTNLHSLVISLVLFAEYCLTFFILSFEKGKKEKVKIKPNKKAVLIIILLIFGFLVPIFQLLPALSSEKQFNLDLSVTNFGKIPGPVVGAFFPIPRIQPDFWGTRLLYDSSLISVAFGLIVFLFSLFLLRRYPKPSFIYLFSCLGLFIVYLVVGVVGPRHQGFLFVVFIFSAWIAVQETTKDVVKKRATRNINLFLITILIAHVLASTIAGYYEINYNFSNSKEVSIFLTENNLIYDDTAIATYYSSVSSSILPYLNKDRRFYCLDFGDYCSFPPGYKRLPKIGVSLAFLEEDLLKFENTKHKNHILILSDYNLMTSDNYKLIASFDNPSITRENYYIYRLVKN